MIIDADSSKEKSSLVNVREGFESLTIRSDAEVRRNRTRINHPCEKPSLSVAGFLATADNLLREQSS